MGSAAIYGPLASANSRSCMAFSDSSHYAGENMSADASMGPDLDGLLFNTDAAAPFATVDSLSSCTQYLEPILRGLGLKQWQLLNGDAVAAVNRLYDLVQQHQRVQESRELAQDELHKAKVDIRVASRTVERLQAQLDAKEQEVGALNIKLRQLDAWYREETERWGHEREELCKKSSQLEQRHVQFQHELRRRDLEIERLQRHLAGQVAASERRRNLASSTGSSSSMVLGSAGTVSRQGSRGHISSRSGGSNSSSQLDLKRLSKAEVEELYKRSVEAYESEKQGLEKDNTALRRALRSLECEHKDLLNRTHDATRTSGAGHISECQASPSNSSSPSSDTGRPSAGYHDSSGSPATAAAAAGLPAAAAVAAADPAAALHRMHANLQALKVRKQRVTGGTPLNELQSQAESASERLLLAKLQEAGRIMEEQETALALALKAISSNKEQHS